MSVTLQLREWALTGGIAEVCQTIGPEQLHNWKLLERFRREIVPVLERAPRNSSEQDERRTLLAEDYFSAYLFSMLNPTITSMRALCHASHCDKMRQVCSRPLSPASFSAAQHVFGPDILDRVVRSLCRQALGRCQGGDARTRQALKALTAVDGTLLRAVPRMDWARSAGPSWAVRLHPAFFGVRPGAGSLGGDCGDVLRAQGLRAGRQARFYDRGRPLFQPILFFAQRTAGPKGRFCLSPQRHILYGAGGPNAGLECSRPQSRCGVGLPNAFGSARQRVPCCASCVSSRAEKCFCW